MREPIRVEICVDSVRSAIAAEQGGARRIELSANLAVGGTTPSFGLLQTVSEAFHHDIYMLIRPRAGDFCYSEAEITAMLADIRIAKEAEVTGVVLGVLDRDGAIDTESARQLIASARPLKVTWHRAFDMAKDPLESLEDIIGLGCECLLTSGQKNRAYDGRHLIKNLVTQARGRIEIMPGSGINETNVAFMRDFTGARIFHASLRETYESPMRWRRQGLGMGSSNQSEFELTETRPERVAAFLEAAQLC